MGRSISRIIGLKHRKVSLLNVWKNWKIPKSNPPRHFLNYWRKSMSERKLCSRKSVLYVTILMDVTSFMNQKGILSSSLRRKSARFLMC